jgi:hypothetical protein
MHQQILVDVEPLHHAEHAELSVSEVLIDDL